MLKTVKHIAVSLIGFILIWQLAVELGDFNDALFPSPYKVWMAFMELVSDGLRGSSSNVVLLTHLKDSMLRFIVGYFMAAVCGILFGLLFGWFPKLYDYVNPVVQLVRPIAPVAWLPFFVLWMGIGDTPAIAIIFIAGFFPILLSTITAVRNIEPVYFKVAKNFGLRSLSTIIKIVFPASFPQISNSLHMALGTCWIFLVSGEMVGTQSGLGFLIMDTKNSIRADALLATMLTIGVVGLVLDLLIGLFEKWVARTWGFSVAGDMKK